MPEPHWDTMHALPLADWRPRQQAANRSDRRQEFAVPAIDVHNHLGGGWPAGAWMVDDPGAPVATLDDCRVATMVNLDGRWGAEVTANVERYDAAYPGRLVTFCQLDWHRLAEPDGVRVPRRSLAPC